MVASVSGLRDRVPDPPGGLLGVERGHRAGIGGPVARRPGRLTPWRIRMTSPTPIQRGRAVMRCASGGSRSNACRRAAQTATGELTPGPLLEHANGLDSTPDPEGTRMSQSTPYRASVLSELRRAITNVAVPHHESPAVVTAPTYRCRRSRW